MEYETVPKPYTNFGEEEIGGMPFAVLLLTPMELFLCSGTMISLWHVIGACQCVASVNRDWHRTYDPWQFRVFGGIVNLTRPYNATTIQKRYIHYMLPHPLCHRTKYGVLYDLAIIYLTFPFILTDYVRPVPMPFMREEDDSSADIINFMFASRTVACKLLMWTKGDATERIHILRSYETYMISYGTCQDLLYALGGKLISITGVIIQQIIIIVGYLLVILKYYYGNRGPFCSQCHICTKLMSKLVCPSGPVFGSTLLCDNKIVGLLSWNYTCKDYMLPLVYARFDTAMDWVGHWLFVAGDISTKVTAEYSYTLISAFIGLRNLFQI